LNEDREIKMLRDDIISAQCASVTKSACAAINGSWRAMTTVAWYAIQTLPTQSAALAMNGGFS
jgi:hypothetical protein